MSTEYVLGRHMRWTCDRCGHARSDSGPDAVLRIQINHRCTEDDMTIIETAWAQLDEQVDEIMELEVRLTAAGVSPDARKAAYAKQETAKARARGKAEILALLTTPFFSTPEEISAEAGRRYQARQAGVEHKTPGIAVSWQPGMAPSAVVS